MSSGKKARVMISCVTFEVAKVVQPIDYYEATKVHILHRAPEGSIYNEFYGEVLEQIAHLPRKTEVVPHDCAVYNLDEVMHEMLCIIQQEKNEYGNDLDMYINISAGTSEFSAASLIVSMMNDDVTIPFTVSAKEYQVSEDKVREVYFENGKPVGLTKECKIPNRVYSYPIEKPPKDKVLALQVLKQQIDKGDTCAATMMHTLHNVNLFEDYETRYTVKNNPKPQQKDVMKYQRNYVDYWLEKGWASKASKRKYKVTDTGNEILNIFYDSYAEEHRLKKN